MILISFDVYMQVGNYRGYEVIPGYYEGWQRAVQLTEDPNNKDVSELVEIALKGKSAKCLNDQVKGVLVDKNYSLADQLARELAKHNLIVVLRQY